MFPSWKPLGNVSDRTYAVACSTHTDLSIGWVALYSAGLDAVELDCVALSLTWWVWVFFWGWQLLSVLFTTWSWVALPGATVASPRTQQRQPSGSASKQESFKQGGKQGTVLPAECGSAVCVADGAAGHTGRATFGKRSVFS